MNPVTCSWVRQQLAASREQDWESRDRPRILDHLATCAACQAVQSDYLKSGELIRRLPAITPPPAFRTAVFAAVRDEALRQAPTMAGMSRAATNPELPVVSLPGVRVIRPASIGQRKPLISRRLSLRVSLVAAAAVLLISLLGARLISLIGSSALSGSAASLSGAAQPKIAHYPLSSNYFLPNSAMATAAWLVYTATNADHLREIIAVNRRTGDSQQLLPAPANESLTVRALTDHWVIWTAGDGTSASRWRLYASPLATTGFALPITLVDSEASAPDSLATLGGVWASDDTVLVAGAPRSGTGELLKIELSAGDTSPTIIARGQLSRDVLTDPSLDHGTYYWADVWSNSATGLHSTIWKGDGAGHNQSLSAGQAAFHPQVSQNTLVWVEVAAATLQHMTDTMGAATPDSDVAQLYLLGGLLDERDLITGRQWQLSSQAKVDSVVVAGQLLLWQSGTETRAYDLSSKTPLAADAAVHSATLASATSSSITWLEGSDQDIFVYDAA